MKTNITHFFQAEYEAERLTLLYSWNSGRNDNLNIGKA